MEKRHSASFDNVFHHDLHRGNFRNPVFRKEGDDVAFLKLFKRASERVAIRLLCYCSMPSHFYLVLWLEHGDRSAPVFL